MRSWKKYIFVWKWNNFSIYDNKILSHERFSNPNYNVNTFENVSKCWNIENNIHTIAINVTYRKRKNRSVSSRRGLPVMTWPISLISFRVSASGHATKVTCLMIVIFSSRHECTRALTKGKSRVLTIKHFATKAHRAQAQVTEINKITYWILSI